MIEVKKILPFVLSAMIAFNGCAPAIDPKTSLKKDAYSEITAFPVQSEGEFQTQTGRARWTNYAGIIVKPAPMERLFRYYQDWVSQNPTMQIPWEGQTLKVNLTKRPSRDIDLYIIPKDAPVPAWWVANKNAGTRVYYSNPQGHEESITIVRGAQPEVAFTPDKISDVLNNDTDAFLAVETCQSLVRIEGGKIDYRLLQELLCNSAKVADFMHKNNYSYELYSRFVSQVPMYGPQGQRFPLLSFSPDRYASFPSERIIASAR